MDTLGDLRELMQDVKAMQEAGVNIPNPEVIAIDGLADAITRLTDKIEEVLCLLVERKES